MASLERAASSPLRACLVKVRVKPFSVVGHLMLFISKADCNSARTVPDKSRASPRSSRTRASFSRSVPAVGARYSSSAPRARFGRSPYPPVGADPPGRPSPVALPKVAVERPLPVAFGNTPPKLPTGLLAPLTDGVGHNLAGTPTQSQPNPAFSPLFEDERSQLVQFQDLPLGGGGSQGLSQRRQFSRFF